MIFAPEKEDPALPIEWVHATFHGGPSGTPSVDGNRPNCPCGCRLDGGVVHWDYVWGARENSNKSDSPRNAQDLSVRLRRVYPDQYPRTLAKSSFQHLAANWRWLAPVTKSVTTVMRPSPGGVRRCKITFFFHTLVVRCSGLTASSEVRHSSLKAVTVSGICGSGFFQIRQARFRPFDKARATFPPLLG